MRAMTDAEKKNLSAYLQAITGGVSVKSDAQIAEQDGIVRIPVTYNDNNEFDDFPSEVTYSISGGNAYLHIPTQLFTHIINPVNVAGAAQIPPSPSPSAAAQPMPTQATITVDYKQLATFTNPKFLDLVCRVAEESRWDFSRPVHAHLQGQLAMINTTRASAAQSKAPMVDYKVLQQITDDALFKAVVIKARSEGWDFNRVLINASVESARGAVVSRMVALGVGLAAPAPVPLQPAVLPQAGGAAVQPPALLPLSTRNFYQELGSYRNADRAQGGRTKSKSEMDSKTQALADEICKNATATAGEKIEALYQLCTAVTSTHKHKHGLSTDFFGDNPTPEPNSVFNKHPPFAYADALLHIKNAVLLVLKKAELGELPSPVMVTHARDVLAAERTQAQPAEHKSASLNNKDFTKHSDFINARTMAVRPSKS